MGFSTIKTLSQLFVESVEQHPKPQAVLYKREGRYVPVSSEGIQRLVAVLALNLGTLGITSDDRFAILSENRLEWLVTDYALMGLGAINVPLYPTSQENEVEYILHDSDSKGILVSTEEQLVKIINVWPRLPNLRCVLVSDKFTSNNSMVRPWGKLVQSSTEQWKDHWERFRYQALLVEPNQLASILYTSGTTGKPKGVQLTHRNITSNVLAAAKVFTLGRNYVAMSFLPLSHVFERALDYLYFLTGATIAYAENLEALPSNLLEVRPTVMAVVPRVFEKVHTKIKITMETAPSWRKKLFKWATEVGKQYYPFRLGLPGSKASLGLRFKWFFADRLVATKIRGRLGGRIKLLLCGSAPLAKELADFFYSMGLLICEGYGLTETSPTISVNYPGHIKVGTVGPVLPGVELKLAQPEGGREQGREILVRGPNVTPGYYHLEEENKKAFTDGWFRTGDLGLIDKEGYLSITGRKKNLFKTSGGKYIAPEKLENLFQGHPFVAQVVTLGDRRKFCSALIVPNFARLESWAQLHELEFSSRKELIALPKVISFMTQQVQEVTAHLAPFEQIRQIALLVQEFTIDSEELSPTQKIKRQIVEDRYRELIEEIYSRSRPESI